MKTIKNWAEKCAQMIENHYNGIDNTKLINGLNKADLLMINNYLRDCTCLRFVCSQYGKITLENK